MEETEKPIDIGNVYIDSSNGHISDYVRYVVVEDFYVDEAGETQVSVGQYMDKPIAAHNSCSHVIGVDARRTVTAEDLRKRILDEELVYDKRI